ncbi:unnamed protein product [Cyprideis torosa]|uniref:receptor protein-tyrosine kinase n=1 Tax=Cyprideis torosa TaxID=163714 RepID=A0A7R8ZFQ6_9CRUS|nr:unnamed protein product [Cyprideis torosa]CAG0879667.1 unnamed protein product [Cyprideis torosa]
MPMVESLGQVFPSLSVIRGHRNVSGFALVVQQCHRLLDLGLGSLTLIQRGGVHVEKNPLLCFWNTINWDLIAKGQKLLFLDNMSSAQCPEICPQNCTIPGGGEAPFCWNMDVCQKNCPKVCRGKIIYNRKDAMSFKGCTKVRDSLEIQFRDYIDDEFLEEFLGEIREIQSELKVIRSHQLFSLSFFKNLRLISGEKRKDGRNRPALVMMDNQNLRKLFPVPVTILGNTSFHYNPRLCKTVIDDLRLAAKGDHSPFTWAVGHETNGYREACIRVNLKLTINSTNSTSCGGLATSPPAAPEDLGSLKERHPSPAAPRDGENMTAPTPEEEDDGTPSVHQLEKELAEKEKQVRRGEGDWWYDINIKPTQTNATIPNLTPYTRYAFYVKAEVFKTYNTSGNQFGLSDVEYVTTMEWEPDPPRNVRVREITHNTLNITWEIPLVTNGPITEYHVRIALEEEDDLVDVCPNGSEPRRKRSTETNVITKKENTGVQLKAPSITFPEPASYTSMSSKDGQCVIKDYTEGNIEQEKSYVEYEDFLLNTHLRKPGAICEYLVDVCSILCRPLPEGDSNRSKRSLPRAPDESENAIVQKKPAQKPIYLGKIGDAEFWSRGKAIGAKTGNMWLMVGPMSLEEKVVELHPYSRYRIHVRACHKPICTLEQRDQYSPCSRLCSPWNNETVARTKVKADADRIPSEGLTYEKLNDTSIRLFWNAPLAPNRKVLGYYIRYRNNGLQGSYCVRANNKSDYYQHDIARLAPGQITLTVCALSRARTPTNCTESDPLELVVNPEVVHLQLIYVAIGLGIVFLGIPTAYFYIKRRLEWPTLNINAGSLEVKHSRIKILSELASGEYGKVYLGKVKNLQDDEPWTTTAIKKPISTIHRNRSSSRYKIRCQFEDEMKVMLRLKDGPFLVRMLGVVSRSPPHMVIMQLMVSDLKKWLEEQRAVTNSPESEFSKKMILFACQVAQGMAYIHSKNILHRDLATRNCLLDKDPPDRCCVGDFGHAVIVDQEHEHKEIPIPIRWTAPEVGEHGENSSFYSDAWSYGVVLWEIATKGRLPYGDHTDEVRSFIIKGGRLGRPAGCPPEFIRKFGGIQKKAGTGMWNFFSEYWVGRLTLNLLGYASVLLPGYLLLRYVTSRGLFLDE